MNRRAFDRLAVVATRRGLAGVAAGALAARARPAAADPVSAADCATTQAAVFGAERVAQTFVAAVGGKVSALRLRVQNGPEESGKFVVQLLEVDPDTAVPTDKVLAVKRIKPGTLDGTDNVLLEARFKRKAATKVVAGRRYAVAVFRDGSSLVNVRGQPSAAACPGSVAFVSEKPKGAFSPVATSDMAHEVLVGS